MDIAGSQIDAVERDDGSVEVTLPADTSSVPAARRYVTGRWQQLGSDMLDDVQLIVAELVSNAIRHGRPDISLIMRVDPFAIDVAVLDHGREMPPGEATRPDDLSGSGRGLLLVDHLAHRWGVEPLDSEPGKSVWASITRPGT
ncbi:ATP-binding protein [uncultured Jatrophihabitans sp.]|uniref:ATP-binding protein n=1 Tax=uncultured Jatrophihabitans sp. TaxID=1610747 RepID=UPI0035C9DADE